MALLHAGQLVENTLREYNNDASVLQQETAVRIAYTNALIRNALATRAQLASDLEEHHGKPCMKLHQDIERYNEFCRALAALIMQYPDLQRSADEPLPPLPNPLPNPPPATAEEKDPELPPFA